MKIDADQGRISGSLSAYRNVANNEEYDGGGDLASFVSPNGLNGQVANGTGAYFTSDITTYGFTAAMTAAPTEHWRMRLSAAVTRGQFGNGVAFNTLYNDQFYENSAGQVTYANGTVVYVPATFNSKQPTVAAGTAGATPLTVTMLSTPGNPYYAEPQPVTGAILKTSNGGLTLLNGGSTANGPILTGAVGLPISDYQLLPALSGVTPATQLYAALPGNETWGYPEYSANFTSVYEFSSGWSKGFKLGGTITWNWKNLAYYYYPGGFTGTNFSDDTPFYLPGTLQFDLIVGYTRRFGHVTWSTQLNVYNLFNHYGPVIYPSVTTGWGTPSNLTANLDQQPRSFVWTNTIAF